jgi:DNA-binding IclR family transcriptional regulator
VLSHWVLSLTLHLANKRPTTIPFMASKPQAGIQSVEVGFALLNALANARAPMMLRDLGVAAGMSAAKAHRYLVSFQRLGLVVQDEHNTRYDLGPAALKLGLASLERLDAVQLARARMNELMLQVGQTLAIAVWGNHGPTIVHWQESPQAVTVNLRLGDVMPLLTSATGRCFAAYAPPEAIAGALRAEVAALAKAATTALRNDAPTTMAAAQALLALTRQHGLGRVCDTLLPGIVGFCAPVFDASGHMALGLVSLGSTASFDADWNGAVATPLKRCARQLSSDLGAPQTV